MKKIYLILSVIGLILPLTQFAPWSMVHGFDLNLLISEMFANQIASGIAIDALLAAASLICFILIEHKKRPVKFFWLPIVSVFLVGLAFAFPLFLYLKEISNNDLSTSN